MMMTLVRKAKKPDYTIGKLYINGAYFCDTLEDTDRGLDCSMSVPQILKVKVPGKTCIPSGLYLINMDTVSARLSKSPFYMAVCGGKVPRLTGVKGFDGVLMHAGNSDKDTEGCILVGRNRQVGKVLDSKAMFAELYKALKHFHALKEEIYLKIE